MMGQYCMTHEMNLVVQLLSNLPIVAKLEDFLQSLPSYFSSSPKQHLEFIKLEYHENKEVKKIPKCENSMDKHVGAFEMCDGKVEDIGHRIMFMLFKQG
jgi:hypothetical protein